jgi:hypothetical protein
MGVYSSIPGEVIPPTNENWKFLGTITVESGLCCIGAPESLKDILRGPLDQGFTDKLGDIGEVGFKQVAGSIVTKTGFGDGEYNVYAKIKHGRVMEVKISFKDEC